MDEKCSRDAMNAFFLFLIISAVRYVPYNHPLVLLLCDSPPLALGARKPGF